MPTTSAQILTLIFVVAMTLVIIAYDVCAIRISGPDASISRVVSRLLAAWPTLALALVFWLGVLVGHVWLPSR
jgi:hypothetical protein